jgi:hypothetical protein
MVDPVLRAEAQLAKNITAESRVANAMCFTMINPLLLSDMLPVLH